MYYSTTLYILEDPVGQDAVSVDAIHCICQGPHGCRGIHREGWSRGRDPSGHPNRLDIPGKSPGHKNSEHQRSQNLSECHSALVSSNDVFTLVSFSFYMNISGDGLFLFRGESFYSDECANKYGNFSSNVTLLKRYLKLVPLDKSNTTAKILIIRCLFWWMMIRYVNRRHDRMYRVNGTGTTIVKLMNRSLKQNK